MTATPPAGPQTTPSEHVRVEVEDGIATIRLDRPPMNALNVQVQEEIRAAAAQVSADAAVHAVVLYGGEKVFAAGADVKEMADMGYPEMFRHGHLLQDFTRAVAAIGKPTVSAITGFALGGGLELALATDLRFCADDAKLGQPEILLGIIPGAGGTQRLARLIGPSKAKDLIYTGRFVGADEALAASGLDYTIVRPGMLTDEEGTGLIEAAAELERMGGIPRDDVAATLAACLDTDNTIGKSFDLLGGQTTIADALAAL